MFGSRQQSPRLAGWDGRRRSSRADALFRLADLRRRAVAVRLAVVAVTAAAVVAVVAGGSPPFPFRVGQTLPRDVRARVGFTIINEVETARRRDNAEATDPAGPVEPVVDRYAAGLVVQKRDEPISREKLALLYVEHKAHAATLTAGQRFARGLGLALVVGLLATAVAVYCARFQPGVVRSLPAVVGIGGLVVGTVALSACLNHGPWYAGLVPLTATAMVLTIAYNPPFALLISLCLAIATSLADGPDMKPVLVQMGGLAAAVLTMRQVRSRSRPVEVGLMAGAAYLAMSVAVGLMSDQTAKFILADGGRNFLWGATAGFLVAGALPSSNGYSASSPT